MMVGLDLRSIGMVIIIISGFKECKEGLDRVSDESEALGDG